MLKYTGYVPAQVYVLVSIIVDKLVKKKTIKHTIHAKNIQNMRPIPIRKKTIRNFLHHP